MVEDTRRQQLEAVCRMLIKTAEASLCWQWDASMAGALTVFEKAAAAKVSAWLKSGLPLHWDAKQLSSAPASIRDAVAARGGLRDNQFVLASHADGAEMIIALWWPWGGGERISLRITACGGPSTVGLQEASRGWFGLA